MKKFLLLPLAVAGVLYAASAQRTISGTVSDDAGEPLIGATVLALGTGAGTVTNLDGYFQIQVPEGVNTLQVSYTGFKPQDVDITSASEVKVMMEPDQIALGELIVVGYGDPLSRRDVTGSISKVSGDKLADLPAPSVAQLLAGRAAGVQIQTTSGLLGASPVARIRGVNSITSGTSPLLVVDGVPAFSGNVGGFTSANALSDLNPQDIESIEVLKDGAATAIYGSRGANGVILITTKKGRAGKPKFTYDGYMGVAQATELFDLLNAEQFVEVSNEKNTNNGGTGAIANLQTRGDGSVVDTKWEDYIFRKGTQQSHTFSATGGNLNSTYYLSMNYTDMQGIARGNDLTRYSLRANLEQKVNDWLSTGVFSGVSHQINNGPLTGSNNLSGNMFAYIRMLPNVDVYDETHPTGYNVDLTDPRSLGRGANTITIANGIPNQRFVLDNDRRVAKTWRLYGNVYAQAKLLEGLSLKTIVGFDGSLVDDLLFQDPRHGDGFSANGRVSQALSPSIRWNWQNILNYTRSFGDHNLNLTGVQEFQKDRVSFFQSTVSDLSDRFFQENVISGTYANEFANGDLNELGISSYLFRALYNFAGKYYIGVSGRLDKLSSLPEENKQGFFPGASFAYRISEESFWDGMRDVISDFRIRGSYAEAGNTNIGYYPALGSYGAGQYGSQNGIAYNNFGNDELKWESQTKLDFGFDLGLFDNRLGLIFAYYQQDNDDLILAAPTPPSVGIPGNVINRNIGRVLATGLELTLDYDVVRAPKVRWNTSINFTTQEVEVKSLVDGQDIITDYNIIRENESLRAIYGYEYWGVNPANGNPVYYKADGSLVQGNIANLTYYAFDPNNPDDLGTTSSLSSTADRKILGNALPKWYGGMDNNISVGNFDINIFLRFSGGNMIMNRTRADLLTQSFSNNSTEILGRWQSPENPGDGMTPRVRQDQDNFINLPNFASTRFVEKGDFLKVQNIGIGYTLPRRISQKANIETLRVYVNATNILTFTEYSGLDPETSTSFSTNAGFGEDFNGNPQQRVITAGLTLGF